MKTPGRGRGPSDKRGIERDILEGFDGAALKLHSNLSKWFVTLDAAKQALKPGDPAPEFLLPDSNGRLVSSRELRDDGPLVISFFCGSWSVGCAAKLGAFQAASAEFRALGATLVAISPDTGGFSRELRRERQLDLAVLSDVDYGIGLAFGILSSLPEEMKSCLLQNGIDLGMRHGTRVWLLPVPSTFIIDRHGAVAATYVEPDLRSGVGLSVILEQLLLMAETPSSG
ncbi:MAG TPA: peroxiredoxin-like family protein [Aliidongia sp.]|nr:peroxiredoxin-like family protein [Aliidongia sp.]